MPVAATHWSAGFAALTVLTRPDGWLVPLILGTALPDHRAAPRPLARCNHIRWFGSSLAYILFYCFLARPFRLLWQSSSSKARWRSASGLPRVY